MMQTGSLISSHGDQTKAGVTVYTSAALNYLPKVRVLFSSLRRHHPDWKLILLLAESIPVDFDPAAEPFDGVLAFSDLAIPHWRPWAFCHSLTELATAIKPFMLQALLSQTEDGGKIFYFDPDIAVFSPLNDLLAALDTASIVLTPHQADPETSLEAVIDNELCSLKHGIYNLGFLGVRADDVGRSFARWWGERCYYFCRNDIRHGLFTDQRLIDLVPALFSSVGIMRSRRFNLATWNITTRHLSQAADQTYWVNDERLGFYHFTGFDSGVHRVMAIKNGKGNPALEAIIRWYEHEVRSLNSAPQAEWSLARFNNGEKILPAQRELYRFRVDLQTAFPDPFDAAGYQCWWQQHGEEEFLAYQQQSNRTDFYLTPGFLGPDGHGYTPPSLISMIKRLSGNPVAIGRAVPAVWRLLSQKGWNRIIKKFRA